MAALHLFDDKKLPRNADVFAVARNVIWFESPADALDNHRLFLAHLMTYGTIEDIVTIRRYLSLDDFRLALENAPPGVFDPRSWAYWNVVTGRDPDTPMPVRHLPGIGAVPPLNWTKG